MKPGMTVLPVTDNGTGMARPNHRSRGMGLRIMNYRADVIGAALGFSVPQAGTGTVVRCSIPGAGKAV
jgi:nitrate/nitrite-specific signal transduction histidine kinase